MENIYSVSEVNERIKYMLENDYVMRKIQVRGQVLNCKYHSNGQIYFSLKDESGTIACVMYAGYCGRLSFRLTDGQEVTARGKVSVYVVRGIYQLQVTEITKEVDLGELYRRLELLKKELEEMGMFAQEYKQPIPKFTRKIGAVTSPTGAVIDDIIKVAKRRNPFVEIILYPSLVEGSGAAENLVRGITYMQEHVKPDVIIIARGGGSIEELWEFNRECVAHAIFHCSIPIISAVGHGPNTTISDFVADRYAVTPTEAAEFATFEYALYENAINEYKMRLSRDMQRKVQSMRKQVEHYGMQMKYLHPESKLRNKQQRLLDLETRLQKGMQNHLRKDKHRLELSIAKMKGLSPLEKLSQGFSYVSNEDEKNVRSISDVRKDERVTIAVTDGMIVAKVIEVKEEVHHGE